MMMLSLAWKNIWRNRKRSLIILAATAIGLTGGLFSAGVTTGMYDAMVDAGINRELGELQIHTKVYAADRQVDRFIPDMSVVRPVLDTLGAIRAYATHTLLEGMASSANASAGVLLTGIDPGHERRVTAIAQSLTEGTYLDKPNSIVIGSALADKLKLRLRSRLVMSFAGLNGAITYAAFRIGGIFRTDATNFDLSNVFVRQADLEGLLGTLPVHEILIRLHDRKTLDATRDALRQRLPDDLLVETWRDISPELKLTADSTDITNTILLGLILFALLFGLTNTLLMSVLDRVRDFGILLAVGMYRRRLFAMIIYESLFLSFSGGITGVLLGWGIIQYFHGTGIDLSSLSAGLSTYGIPSILHPYVRSSLFVSLTIMMVVTSLAAAIYPAIKAVRLKPVEAIRTIA